MELSVIYLHYLVALLSSDNEFGDSQLLIIGQGYTTDALNNVT